MRVMWSRCYLCGFLIKNHWQHVQLNCDTNNDERIWTANSIIMWNLLVNVWISKVTFSSCSFRMAFFRAGLLGISQSSPRSTSSAVESIQHVVWSKRGNLLVIKWCCHHPYDHCFFTFSKYTTPVIRYHKTWAGNFLSQVPFIKYVHAWSTSFTACPRILFSSSPPTHTHTQDMLRSRGGLE